MTDQHLIAENIRAALTVFDMPLVATPTVDPDEPSKVTVKTLEGTFLVIVTPMEMSEVK